jgi:hypothetical protein
MNDDKEFEFVNIERDELPCLQNYVAYYLKERKRKEAAAASVVVVDGEKSAAFLGINYINLFN